MPRLALLAQLPIPPFGIEPIRGNVPLAAAYLKMYAEAQGTLGAWRIEILDPRLANLCGDQALVERILEQDPELVGFSCYLWNIQRTLYVARALKRRRPELKILLGGPEITLDNAWGLGDPAVDYAAIGEGEQTLSELLTALDRAPTEPPRVAGLYVAPPLDPRVWRDVPTDGRDLMFGDDGADYRRPIGELPFPRQPLPKLDPISSPYLCGILDAADERMMLLETIRGCIYNCKFCFYPKSYDDLYFVAKEKIAANLAHARERGAKEVVILDPTLNQRAKFNDFVRELGAANAEHGFRYFGEIRSEGIMADTAKLLRDANFTDIEIGLQSIDPLTMDLMDRTNNLKSFERAAGAMIENGIRVQVDLIIGLPGDTVDSVRRGLEYLHQTKLYSSVQVFNLAILPGTAFRHEAADLGLRFQERPPYYVLNTPTLDLAAMYELMAEAQALFQTEFDPLAEAVVSRTDLDWSDEAPIPSTQPAEVGLVGEIVIDLDRLPNESFDVAALALIVPPTQISQAFNLRLRSEDFQRSHELAANVWDSVLAANPHGTYQVTLEGATRTVTPELCAELERIGYARPSYLDRFYSVLPGPIKGAKRLVVAAEELADDAFETWLDAIEPYAEVILPATSDAAQA
ncbi:MAG: cobalamin-dependent protein [Pirellulales bacterium]